jgi:hypothetical protein
MTRDDLLFGNRDLVATCLGALGQMPFSRLAVGIDRAGRTLLVTTSGLDRVDLWIDGHPGATQEVSGEAEIELPYPAAARVVELVGFAVADVRQRRRVRLRE